MNKGLKRAAVFGLSASLLATSLAGCSKSESSAFDADAVLMTINEEEVPAGLFKFAVHYSQAQTQYIYDSYFGDNSFSYEYSDGYTIGDMVKSSALASFEEMILARQHMDEYEVELTEDEETAISEAAAAFIEANDEEVLTAMSATQEIVEEYLSLITIQNKMETAMSADVDREVSDEEAAQRRIEYVYVAMETEGETEEETDTEEVETDSEAAESDSEEETAEADSDEDNEETEAAADTEAETVADTESETALLTGTTAVKTTSADETETETAAADEAETVADVEEDTEDAEEADADEETDAEEASEEETETETETETEDPEVVAAMEEAYAKAEQIIALVQDGTDLEEAAQSIDEDLSVNEITFGSDSTSVVEGLITSTEGLDDDTLVAYPVEASSGYYVVRVVNAFDEEATEEEKESIIEERISDAIDELYTEWEEDADISTDEDVYATITFDFNLSLYEEEETETDTEEASEGASEDETDAETESETEAASDAETEEETEAASEAETEEETETASDAETEETETEEETVAETEAVETESETESEEA